MADYTKYAQVQYIQYEPPDEYRRNYFIDEFNKISHSISLLSGEYFPRRSVSDAKTDDYTATIFDDVLLINGTVTVYLYTASGGTDQTGNIANSGRRIVIKNIGSGVVTIDPSEAQTIDGATTKQLTAQYEVLELVSDGSNWHII